MSVSPTFVIASALAAAAFTASSVNGQDAIRVHIAALQSFAVRSPVAGLVRHGAELELTPEQITRLREIEASTRAGNLRLLEQHGIKATTSTDATRTTMSRVERSLLLALRENVRLGAVRAKSVLNAKQRALERDLITGARGGGHEP